MLCRTRLSLEGILSCSPDELDCSLLTEGRSLGMKLLIQSPSCTVSNLLLNVLNETPDLENQVLAWAKFNDPTNTYQGYRNPRMPTQTGMVT